MCQDGSGTISTEELLHVLRAMGQNPSEEELNNTIMEIDIDGSGTIDFFEFVNLMKDKANEVDIDNDIRWVLQTPSSQEHEFYLLLTVNDSYYLIQYETFQ